MIVTFEFLPFSGGIAVYTGALAGGLSALGCEVVVLAPAYPGSEAVDRSAGYETVRMKVTHGTAEVTRVIPGLRYLARLLRSMRPDVALLTSDLAHGLGSVTCGAHGVPYVAVVHGSEVVKHFPPATFKRYLQSRALKFCYSRAKRVICVSEYVRSLMLKAGFDRANLRVIRNGVDESLADTPSRPEVIDSIRRRHGLSEKKIILTVSRLAQRKGHAQVIEAIPEILSRHPDALYLIVGKGQHEERLRALAAEKNVNHAVVFAGEIPEDEKVSYLDVCDVYVLLSHSDGQRVEGFGIALLEAALRSKPLVGGRHGGITEIIQHEVTGYLVDASDSREVAARVCTLLDDPARARAMGEAAKQRVVKEFPASRMVSETRSVLEEAVAGSDASS